MIIAVMRGGDVGSRIVVAVAQLFAALQGIPVGLRDHAVDFLRFNVHVLAVHDSDSGLEGLEQFVGVGVGGGFGDRSTTLAQLTGVAASLQQHAERCGVELASQGAALLSGIVRAGVELSQDFVNVRQEQVGNQLVVRGQDDLVASDLARVLVKAPTSNWVTSSD
nr:hypothetical protein [Brevundimonas vesicularis]